jgi:hypothetical protein
MNRYQATALQLLGRGKVLTIYSSLVPRDIVDRELGPMFDEISDVLSLTQYALALAELIPIPANRPTIHQWTESAEFAGLSPDECNALGCELRRSAIYASEGVADAISNQGMTGVGSIDIYNYDGNTVRKLSSAGITNRKAEQNEQLSEIPIVIWLSGNVDAEDQKVLEEAVNVLASEDLLEREDASFVYSTPVRGSYFQTIRLVGHFKRYGKSVVANLLSAFESLAMRHNIDAVDRLSQILHKHDSAVIHVGSSLAVKVTRQRKTFTIILHVMPDYLKKALADDPQLVTRADRLYDLIQSTERVTRLSLMAEPKKKAAACPPAEAASFPRASED